MTVDEPVDAVAASTSASTISSVLCSLSATAPPRQKGEPNGSSPPGLCGSVPIQSQSGTPFWYGHDLIDDPMECDLVDPDGLRWFRVRGL